MGEREQVKEEVYVHKEKQNRENREQGTRGNKIEILGKYGYWEKVMSDQSPLGGRRKTQ